MHGACISLGDFSGEQLLVGNINNASFLRDNLRIQAEHDDVGGFEDEITMLACCKTGVDITLCQGNGRAIGANGNVVNLYFGS